MTDGVEENKPGCICKGNWRLIVNDYEDKIGNRYIETRTGKEYCFFGLVWGDDDFYYGMIRKGQLVLSSCVGSLEGSGYKEIGSSTKKE